MKVAVVGNADFFTERLEYMGVNIQPLGWNELSHVNADEYAALFCFPDDADDHDAWYDITLEQAEIIDALAATGLGVYTECLSTYGWRMRDMIGTQNFVKPRVVWRERSCIVNTPGSFKDFDIGDILDCRNAVYVIGRSSHVPILTVGTIGGMDRTEEADGQNGAQSTRYFHVLYRFREARRQICANIDLRNVRRKGFFPQQRWAALIDRIILEMLPPREARGVRPKIASPRFDWKFSNHLFKSREIGYRTSLSKNIAWFERSGVLPTADGSLGIYEGFDTYGKLMNGYRPECQTESALMFWYAAEVLGRPELQQRAHNIMRFLLDSSLQVTDAQSPLYGLWHFYMQSRADHGAWFIDTSARAAMGLLHFYRLTAKAEYLHRAQITLRKIQTMQNAHGVLPDCADPANPKLSRLHIDEAEIAYCSDRRFGTPHHHSSVVAAFVLAHELTGDSTYLKTAVEVQSALCKGFPYQFEDEFAWPFTIARYLLGLTALLRTTHKSQFIDPTRAALEKLRTLRHEASGSYLSARFGDMNYTSFETGMVWSDHDQIVDNLYVDNYLCVALRNLAGMPEFVDTIGGWPDDLLDFQAAIQSRCQLPGQPEGAWTRAFNLQTGDPYAYNGDIGWGPYCVLTGWSNSVISLGLMMRLNGMKHLIL